ncbi:MAG TPA: glucoamylase family protein, partial [Planctomycetota bacterium]|nr:glucoamylase family protein [Planctomycetota bacterium]
MRQAQGWATFHRAMGWNQDSPAPLPEGGDAARRLVEQAHRCAGRATALAEAMDFRPLYNQRRRLFAIGMHLDDGRVDRSCYDLLASEARLTSYLAVARGQASLDHWFVLGRFLVDVDGRGALISWSGSMFEYLMPDLLMPEFPDTLLATGQRAMLVCQIAYGQTNRVPWGVSESGYHLTDAAQQWQYRAFGVPGLGLKHGLGDDLVVAFYASALALLIDPAAAAANLQRLRDDGMLARHGFYEAVDYTPARLPPGTTRAVVRSWMAHHQGMTLLSCVHVLAGAPMRARFRADPHLRALELLLQERAPQQAPFEEAEEESRPLTPAEEAAGTFVVTNPNAAQMEATLLSNGRYHVLITAGGGGVSRWRGLALNRWHEDALSEEQGLFCWLRDVERGQRWSVTQQPAQSTSRFYEAIFTQAKAEFRRRDHDIDCTCEIALASEDDIELRRLTLVNRSGVPRTIEVTTCGELVVGSPAADIAHQAFSGLGLATRFDPEIGALFCHRRPRRSDEPVPVVMHLIAVHGAEHSPASVDTDRARFIGRGRTVHTPIALDRAGPLGGCIPLPLDTVAAMRRRVQLPPDVPVVIDVVWGIAEDAAGALLLAQRYRERTLTDRVSGLAWAQSRLMLHQLGIGEETAQAAARLVAGLATVFNTWRAPAGVVALNRRPQSALWAHSISGDLPILLLRIADVADLEVVRDCLGAYAWWRAKGMPVDVVLWNDDPTAYRQDLHERLATLVEQAKPLDGRPGIVVLRHADQVVDDDRIALFSAARIVLDAAHGPFLTQSARRPRPARTMDLLQPPRAPRSRAMAPAPIPAGLTFLNGMGGFDPDGAYVVVLDPSATTPAPWINVLANENFGALISATGASCTWDGNCHEFRITPWPNDSVTERCGEALYLRDEEDGGFWSPSPWPAAAPARYVVRHAQGMTSFTCHHDDLVSEMIIFVAAHQPVRVWRWRITNRGDRMRRLSVTWCGELVLGEQRRREAPFIITARDPVTGALVARNPHHPDLPRRHVAIDVNLRTRQVSGDRATVLGRNRGWERPEVMVRSELDGRVGAALDPCLAIQAPFDLAPGQMREVVFTLACGEGMDAAALAGRWCAPGVAGSGQAEVAARWQGLCDRVQVTTPDRALDLQVNRW